MRSELLQERPSQDPSHAEIGARLGLKGDKVAELTKIGRVQSLDAPLQVRASPEQFNMLACEPPKAGSLHS